MTTAISRRSWLVENGHRVREYTAKRQGRYYTVFPGLSGSRRFGVHNNNLVNGSRALVERVFGTPDADGAIQLPPPCTADVGRTLRGFKIALHRRLGVHRPVSREQFLEYYSGRRRDVYARAVASLERSPLTRADFSVQNAFVKAEKINFTAKPDPAPRVIQPRDPRYNVEVGVYLRPLEHRLYEAIAQIYGGPTVMKGFNATQVASHLREMWDSFRDPVAVGLDASRFDQHVRPEMLRWEHSVYLGCFVGAERRRLAWLLSGQVRNKCSMRCEDGTVRYRVDGSRMSGDMNTALGNCLIMCALVHRLAGELGIRVRLANNGDDCTVIMERQSVERFRTGLREWFHEYGFNMKVEDNAYDFEQIEFCQAHPVWLGEWVMVRNPLISMSKDAVCVNRDYSAGRAAAQWLHAVGQCGLSMVGGCPVLQEYYSAFLRHGIEGLRSEVVSETGMAYLSRGCTRVYGEVSEASRYSFWLAFGIWPGEQKALEQHWSAVQLTIPVASEIAVVPPPPSLQLHY